MNERQKNILNILAEQAEVSVQGLSEAMDVSGVTIRQDLTYLENQGLLKRVHGGAVLKDADDMDIRMSVQYDIKLQIARRAAAYVHQGETVLLESGSINALLARELVRKGRITLITSNVYIARQFRNNREAPIILTGGLYQPVSESMVGKLARRGIDQLHFSKAFIGIDGYTEQTGFTSKDLLRAEISSHIIDKCEENFILTDSSKFGHTGLTTICEASAIQHLITDHRLEPHYRGLLTKEGVDVIMA